MKLNLRSILILFLVGTQSFLNAATSAQWNSLIQALRKGQIATVQQLVPAVIKPSDTTLNNRTPLQMAEYELAKDPQSQAKKQVIAYIKNQARAGLLHTVVTIAASLPALYQVLKQGKSASWKPDKTIQLTFYDKADPFYEFTNFYVAPITLDGQVWQTTEHYFQAQKFPTDPHLQQRVRTQGTPGEVFRFARLHDAQKRPDWDTAKDALMLKALQAKFTQHPELRHLLLGTGQAKLVEASPKDPYWGWGSNQKGLNKLGTFLMQVRDELQSTGGAPAQLSPLASTPTPVITQLPYGPEPTPIQTMPVIIVAPPVVSAAASRPSAQARPSKTKKRVAVKKKAPKKKARVQKREPAGKKKVQAKKKAKTKRAARKKARTSRTRKR